MDYPPLTIASAGDNGGSGFYRIIWPLVVCDIEGVIQLKIPQGFTFLPPELVKVMKPDAIMFHKCHTEEQIKYIRSLDGPLLVYTIDDWVEKVPKNSPHFPNINPEIGKLIRSAVRSCDRLVVPNELLATQYGYKTDTSIIPNYLPWAVWQDVYQNAKRKPRANTKFRVGWSGGINHLPDLMFLKEVAHELGESVEWVFLGTTPDGFSYDNSEIHDPVTSDQHPRSLYSLDLDLALAPMLDNDFNRARTNLKVLEYAACGYPVICSAVPPYDNCPVDKLEHNASWWARLIREKMVHGDRTAEEGKLLTRWVWDNYKMEDHVSEYSDVLSRDGHGFRPVSTPVVEAVDVVVTAYKNRPVLERCITSVLAATNSVETELIIVDDGAEPTVTEYLTKLSDDGSATVIQSDPTGSNQGYVKAVNAGIRHHPDRDVVILNSDTVVNGDWVDRLKRDAYEHPRTASVTPFSNQATICSYPILHGSPINLDKCREYDQLAAEVNMGPAPIPLPVGFCTYLRREALNDLGFFDANGFGRGYGEENDWGFRAAKRHWSHVVGSNVYVGHEGGAVFKDERQKLMEQAGYTISARWPQFVQTQNEWMETNPLIPLRSKLDIVRAGRTKGRTLIFAHLLLGGIELFLREYLPTYYPSCIIARPDQVRPYTVSFETLVPEYHNLPSLDIRANAELAANLFRDMGIDRIQLHSFVGYDNCAPLWLHNIIKLGKFQYQVFLHDYFMVCPRAMLASTEHEYCGQPDAPKCNECIADNSSYAGYVNVQQWRETYHELLSEAAVVFAPTQDVIDRYHRYYPDLAVQLRPHDATILPLATKIAQPYKEGERLKVLTMGVLTQEKGSVVLQNCARYCLDNNIPIDFVLAGVMLPQPPKELTNLAVSGVYEETKIYPLLQNIKAHMSFFPGVIPESYSRTLTHAFRCSLYPVAIDIGAIGERIREYGYGTLVPFEDRNNTEAIVNCILETAKHLRPFTGKMGTTDVRVEPVECAEAS